MHFCFPVHIYNTCSVNSGFYLISHLYPNKIKSKALDRTVFILRIVFIFRNVLYDSSLYFFLFLHVCLRKYFISSSGRVLCFVICSLIVLVSWYSGMILQCELKPTHTCSQELTVSISSELYIEWAMESIMTGIFIPQKSTNAIN